MSVESTPRYRRSRTRSRNVSPRPALVLSQLPPHEYDLTSLCTSLVCPDCITWVPITGINSKKPKLVPHDTGVIRNGAPVRCQGSHRLVVPDVSPDKRQKRVEQAGVEPSLRRSARQHYKPMPAPAAPVTKMTPAPVSAADALESYREHLQQCRKSSVAGHCGGTHRCADGARLARLYEQLLRTQPQRDRERVKEARVDELLTRVRSAKASQSAAREWEKRQTDAPRRALAKRSGTEVEEANNTRRIPTPGAISHLRGPQLPLKPLRVTA